MDDFLRKYILAYFKDNRTSYSFVGLAKQLGIPIDELDKIVTSLLDDGALTYTDSHMLSITMTGRLTILDEKEDNLYCIRNAAVNRIVNPDAAWPIEKMYLPTKFLSKI